MIRRALPIRKSPPASGRRATLQALVAAAIAGALPLAASAQAVTLLTGRSSSVHHPLGVALGAALRKSAPPLKPSVKGTKGTADSLEELQQGRAEIEVSGGVTPETILVYATIEGVDYVSMGALTHSAPGLDLSLALEALSP